jgi:molybdate transport system substrate-binding protein
MAGGRGDGWPADWRIAIRVLIERRGDAILADGRAELLEWIDRCRSISGAARQLGISYRHAWVTAQEINRAAGEPLVTAATGGVKGGGAALTERGRFAVRVYRSLREEVTRTAAGLLPRLSADGERRRLHVAAAASVEGVLAHLVADHALRDPSVGVRVVTGASDALVEQLLGGAPADVFITADPDHLRRLAAAGRVGRRAGVPLAENTLVAVAPAGTRLAARGPAGLLVAGVRRVAVAVPTCPLGAYTKAYLAGLGVYDAVRQRAVELDNALAVLEYVLSGDADAGFVYGTAATAEGCRVLFEAPRRDAPIRYTGVVLAGASAAAARFLAFLASADGAARFRQAGFRAIRRRPKPKSRPK